jgi:hypothetical protein
MSKFYSPSTRWFYSLDVHNVNHIPKDAVEITDDRWSELLAAQSKGLEILPGTDGSPTTAVPKKTVDSMRMLRNLALQDTDVLVQRHRDERDMGTPLTLSADQFTALLRWRQELRDLPRHPDFPDVEFPAKPDGLS